MTDRTVIGLPARTPEPYITREELAAIMGVHVKTIDKLVRDGMPSTTFGLRARRFLASTAIGWANAREPHPQVASPRKHEEEAA